MKKGRGIIPNTYQTQSVSSQQITRHFLETILRFLGIFEYLIEPWNKKRFGLVIFLKELLYYWGHCPTLESTV